MHEQSKSLGGAAAGGAVEAEGSDGQGRRQRPDSRIPSPESVTGTFKVGDKVIARGYPFWMTVTAVLPHNRFKCCFGRAGGEAGPSWHRNELEHYAEPVPGNALLGQP